MIFDAFVPQVDKEMFEHQDWKATELAEDITEALPLNTPEPKGMGFLMMTYVDADQAFDSVTRRRQTGFIAYLNATPFYWFSQKQNNPKTSTFSSKFTAMKHFILSTYVV